MRNCPRLMCLLKSEGYQVNVALWDELYIAGCSFERLFHVCVPYLLTAPSNGVVHLHSRGRAQVGWEQRRLWRSGGALDRKAPWWDGVACGVVQHFLKRIIYHSQTKHSVKLRRKRNKRREGKPDSQAPLCFDDSKGEKASSPNLP